MTGTQHAAAPNPGEAMTGPLEGALAYAAMGWHVFPVPPGTKSSYKSAEHSGGRRWGATTDPAEIRRDWRRWPNANVGITCGPDSGLFVIEADTVDGHGIDGVGNFSALVAQHGGLPATIEVVSPTGSKHFYFQWPEGEDIRNSAGEVAPGVDVRGNGGMVLGVPSVRPDGAYRWGNPPPLFDLAECPEWLLILCRKQPKPKPKPEPRTNGAAYTFRPGGAEPWAEAALDYEAAAVARATQGQRNQTLNRAAFNLGQIIAGDHLDQGRAEAALRRAAAACGLEAEETERTMRSGLDAGMASPRGPRESGPTPGGPKPEPEREEDEPGDDAEPKPKREEDEAPWSSDDALALNFAGRNAHRLRYVAAWVSWYLWTGRQWAKDDTLLAFNLARAVCRDVAATCNKPSTRMRVSSAKTVAAVASLSRADRRLAAGTDQWDNDPWLLNTPGGVVDLRTGALRAHRAEDYMTKSTTVAPGGACPLWNAFLDRVTAADRDLQAYLRRLAGYSLTGSTREHVLPFAHGGGGNGKGVFIGAVAGVLGDYHKTAPIETFAASSGDRHPTELAMLRGARLITAQETEEGRRWAESRIKALTGGDRIAARVMHGNFFEFEPQFTLLLAGNHKPGLRSVDEAIRRRFHLIPFTVTIPEEERDEQLGEKLKAEWPGILQWAIEGCLEWQRIGLAPPAVIRAATEAYLDGQDALGAWLDECCDINPNAWTLKTELYASWQAWAERSREFVLPRNRFYDAIEPRGFAEKRASNGARGIQGLSVRQHDYSGAHWNR